MKPLRALTWAGAVVLALVFGAAAGLALVGGNWLRAPIARMALEKTGRALTIAGDLRLGWGWPVLQVQAAKVTFANPAWAAQKNMVVADEVELAVDLPQLFRKRLLVDELMLRRAVVFLEKDAEGRKNWLLDLKQQDENASVGIGRLALDASRIAYDEPPKKTHIQAEAATGTTAADGGADFVVSAHGQYLGMPLTARGSGGSLLALRDESRPYPFKIEATIGRTTVKAEGSVTGLSKVAALDMQVALRGDSLAQIFPLLGIALPETRAYRSAGHVAHSGHTWRYEKFSMRFGDSDLAGTLTVDDGGRRPFLHGELVFGQLDFADLGPVIGAARAPPPGPAATAPAAARRVLPELPFRTPRWNSVDADIRLSAATILHAKELPLEHFLTHLRLRDSVLTLDPVDLGLAGGTLVGVITLDGQHDPIRASAKLRAKKILLGKLFPTLDLSHASVGEIHGDLDLRGSGNSVAHMLGSASGTAALVIAGGEVSKLAMEMAGLHVLEIVALKIAGDKVIDIRCAVADVRVDGGVMKPQTLILDTAITTIVGTGSVDLGAEALDLTLVPKTKETSLVALRSPIHIHGTFAKPVVQLETGRLVARGLGAAALAIANPFLVLVPLIDQGPGMDSDCGRLVEQAAGRAAPSPARTK